MLLSFEQIGTFLASALLLTLSPGPDNLMVISQSIRGGKKSGMAFGFGCAIGCLNHTILAVLGISALVAASPQAFGMLKIAGGLYLFYLGWKAIKTPPLHISTTASTRNTATLSSYTLFLQGLIANAINPKVMLFFLSFLPQFIRIEHGYTGWQMLALGGLFTLQAVVLFGLIAYFAGGISRFLQRSSSIGVWLNRTTALVFWSLGLKLIID